MAVDGIVNRSPRVHGVVGERDELLAQAPVVPPEPFVHAPLARQHEQRLRGERVGLDGLLVAELILVGGHAAKLEEGGRRHLLVVARDDGAMPPHECG